MSQLRFDNQKQLLAQHVQVRSGQAVFTQGMERKKDVGCKD